MVQKEKRQDRDGVYESLHMMELLSVQCLQVPILSPAMYCGRCGSKRICMVAL